MQILMNVFLNAEKASSKRGGPKLWKNPVFLLADCGLGLSLRTDPSGSYQAAQQICSCPCRTIWLCAEPSASSDPVCLCPPLMLSSLMLLAMTHSSHLGHEIVLETRTAFPKQEQFTLLLFYSSFSFQRHAINQINFESANFRTTGSHAVLSSAPAIYIYIGADCTH